MFLKITFIQTCLLQPILCTFFNMRIWIKMETDCKIFVLYTEGLEPIDSESYDSGIRIYNSNDIVRFTPLSKIQT